MNNLFIYFKYFKLKKLIISRQESADNSRSRRARLKFSGTANHCTNSNHLIIAVELGRRPNESNLHTKNTICRIWKFLLPAPSRDCLIIIASNLWNLTTRGASSIPSRLASSKKPPPRRRRRSLIPRFPEQEELELAWDTERSFLIPNWWAFLRDSDLIID